MLAASPGCIAVHELRSLWLTCTTVHTPGVRPSNYVPACSYPDALHWPPWQHGVEWRLCNHEKACQKPRPLQVFMGLDQALSFVTDLLYCTHLLLASLAMYLHDPQHDSHQWPPLPCTLDKTQ